MNETTTPPTDPGETRSGPRVTRDEMTDVRRLRRPHDRMVAGVAAGVARHFDVDPLVVRVAFAVLSFFGGAGVLVYGALWLLLPEDGADRAPVHLDERSRGIAVVGIATIAALALVGSSAGLYWFPWPLVLVGVVVWFFYDRNQRQTRPPAQPYPPAQPAAYGPQTQPVAYGPQPQPAQEPAHDVPPPPPAAPAPVPVPPRPRDPRRRGPILFGFTLALVALAMGTLGTVDLAGVDVVGSAYPALALTVIAVMLVVGAFWGRAGGLILLALIAATTTVGTMVNEGWESEQITHAPTSAADVRPTYEMRSGELVLDLRNVTDLDALDGRRIRADLGVGRLEVVVPDGLSVELNGDVGVGSLRFIDTENGGLGISRSVESLVDGAPSVTLDLDLGVGELVVWRAEDRAESRNGTQDRTQGTTQDSTQREEARR